MLLSCASARGAMLIFALLLIASPIASQAQQISFLSGRYSVIEGVGTARLDVTCTNGLCVGVTCTFFTRDVTAILNVDYRTRNGTIVFPSQGNRSPSDILTGYANISIIDDGIPEVPKEFTVTLESCQSGGTPISLGSGIVTTRVTILDDDTTPYDIRFAVTSVSAKEGDLMVLTILKSGGNPSVPVTVSVDYGVQSLTAIEGEDFASVSGTVTFLSTENSKTITIPIIDDTIPEIAENFLVILSNASPAPYARILAAFAQTNITIDANDDYAGVFGFASGSLAVSLVEPPMGSPPNVRAMTVQRDAGTFGDALLVWSLDGATNPSGQFQEVSGFVNFKSGDRQASFNIAVLADSIQELAQEYSLTLTLLSAGRLNDTSKVAKVYIQANGYPGGVLGFDLLRTYVGSEDSPVPFVTVRITRESGTTGSGSVVYTIVNGAQDFVTPSASVLFFPGDTYVDIDIEIIDDDIPELDEVFTITLSNAAGNVRIDPLRASTKITILKSDDPNGVLEWSSSTRSVITTEQKATEPNNVALLNIVRTRGTFGTISVSWAMQPNDTSDLTPVAGVATFSEGQTSASVSIQVLPDDIPEFDETFVVTLGATTGGARVNPLANRANITIRTNDDPLSFTDDGLIVDEDANPGYTTLRVIRGGDRDDVARVDWATSDGTAIAGQDYVAANGTLIFGIGVAERTFDVQIINDDIPELAETFSVRLSNPVGDAVIVEPSVATVTILTSDDGAGAFGFAAGFTSIVADEGDTTVLVPINVNRTMTALARPFGRVTVTWQLSANASDDFEAISGTLTFADGEVLKTFFLRVKPDDIPELEERFVLTLVSADNGGRIVREASTAVIFIRANDDPHGIFQFSSSLRSQVVAEEGPTGRLVRLFISRTRGLEGPVQINYDITYQDTSGIRTGIVPSPGIISMNANTPNWTHDIPIANSSNLQVGGVFTIQLKDVTLLGPLASTEGGRRLPPVIGSPSTATATVSANAVTGIVSFDIASRSVSADELASDVPNVVTLVINRNVGVWGAVDVQWTIVSAETTAQSSDYSVPAINRIFFAPGQQRAFLNISILPDDIPELDELIVIQLVAITRGSALIDATANKAVITIRENDNPYGSFGFAPDSRGPFMLSESFNDGGADSIVRLEVIRIGGTLGTVLVEWTIIPSPTNADNAPASTDFEVASSRLIFREGDTRKFIFIQVRDDNTPELDENFQVVLTAASNIEIFNGTSSLRILKNDDANGVLTFGGPSSLTTIEGLEPISLFFPVVRSRGLFGTLQVPWRVIFCNPLAQNCSNALTAQQVIITPDFDPTSGVITLREGENRTVLEIKVVPDSIPEDDEVFVLQLLTPSGGARVDDIASQVVITITANDDPIEMAALVTQVSEDVGFVNLTVTRGGRALGTAEVEFRTEPDPFNLLPGLAPGYTPVNGTLYFQANQRQRTISIPIIPDNDPQPDRSFLVRLTPTKNIGDSVVPPETGVAKVVILANDDAGGVFGFAPASLSRTVKEEDVLLLLNILRDAGAFANVQIQWAVDPICAQDLSPSSGTLQFPADTRSQFIAVRVVDDDIPEITENCNITLTRAVTTSVGKGEGRIDATRSVSIISILENDDARGIFMITSSSLNAKAPEDVPSPEFVIGIERSRGVFGSAAVTWDVGVSQAYAQTGYLELAFLSDRTSVTISSPRTSGPRTEFPSYTFGVTPSMLSIPFALQPAATQLSSPGNFTFSLWVKQKPSSPTDVAAPLLTKVVGSSVIYTLTSNGVLGVVLFQFRNEQGQDRAASFLNVRLDTDTWTHLALVVRNTPTNGRITLYIDGVQHPNVVSLTSPLQDTQGTQSSSLFSVGRYGAFPGAAAGQFLGQISEPRFYAQAFSAQEIQLLFINPAPLSDITLLSGQVQFFEGEVVKNVTIPIVDDLIPELEESFLFSLRYSDGGSAISQTQNRTQITIAESDDPYGVFYFSSTKVSAQEGDSVRFTVLRAWGAIGNVSLRWSVQACSECDTINGLPCTPCDDTFSSDLAVTSGQISFPEGVREASFVIPVIDDVKPEFEERFRIVLSLVDVGRINVSETLLVVASSDSPYGLFQITVGAGYEYATNTSYALVPEANNIAVPFVITRLGGTRGSVQVSWSLLEITASASQLPVPDMVLSITSATFAPGETVKTFQVQIMNDDVPEILEEFGIVLMQATLGGEIAKNASRITIGITENDDARGILGFAADSLQRAVNELDTEISVLSLTVQRARGAFGTVSVSWTVQPESMLEDIAEINGTLVLVEGQTVGYIEIRVLPDLIPEVAEQMVVILSSVSGGAKLSTSVTSVVTIRGSDEPHGVFVFEMSSLRVEEPATGSTTTIPFKIRRLGGTIDTVTVFYRTLQQTGPFLATANEDYTPIPETAVVFAAGETEKMVPVSLVIRGDDIPETDESVFVAMTRVTIAIDKGPYDFPSPRIGTVDRVEVIINENDDARGVFRIKNPPAPVRITEELTTPFLWVERLRGTFYNVTITAQARARTGCVENCASPEDFVAALVSFTILEGQREIPIPIFVAQEDIPELDEEFEVALLSVDGGRLDSTQLVVPGVIVESDDPYGIIGFAASSRAVTIDEPDGFSTSPVVFDLVRRQGVVGVLTVSWALTGVDVQTDFRTLSGNVTFPAGVNRTQLTVTAVGDNIPELVKVANLTLTSVVVGKGRVDSTTSFATITTTANDDPHGVFGFQRTALFPKGREADGRMSIPVRRDAGTFGRVSVGYVIKSINSTRLLERNAAFSLDDEPAIVAFDLFKDAQPGRLNNFVIQSLEFVSAPVCLQYCMVDLACKSVNFAPDLEACTLNRGSAPANGPLVQSAQYVYYEKKNDTESILARYIALPNIDFSTATQPLIFEEGEVSKLINITLIPDNIPELEEGFDVEVTSVSLLSAVPPPNIVSPRLNQKFLLTAAAAILENQAPHGIVSIVSNRSSAVVDEGDNITLFIERQPGLFGRIVIGWQAVLGPESLNDLAQTSGRVVFEDLETQKTVRILVIDDDEPELDETMGFIITSISGGAEIGVGSHRVLVRGSDDASGVFGFAPTSRNVSGVERNTPSNVVLTIVRTKGLFEDVELDWEITPISPGAEAADFVQAKGKVTIGAGRTNGTLVVQVAPDDIPELEELFEIRLTGTNKGAASIDRLTSFAIISIAGNDDPYGLVRFADASQRPIVEEGDILQLVVQRDGGTFAAIEVYFETLQNTPTPGLTDAEEGIDYEKKAGSLIIPKGQRTGNISIVIIDDTQPELSETFSVRLIRAELADNTAAVIFGSPAIATGGPERAIVTINANDDAVGVFSFTQAVLEVDEGPGNRIVQIEVKRSGGTLGAVVVPVVALDGFNASTTARNRLDYVLLTDRLIFTAGMSSAFVQVTILDDALPELAEDFILRLLPPSAGRLGVPSDITVVIRENDDPYGIFGFNLRSVNVTVPEPDSKPTPVVFEVNRLGGSFGAIQVAWRLTPVRNADVVSLQRDLSPTSGVVTFAENQLMQFINISVLPDDAPELEQEYVMTLTLPGKGTLGTYTRSGIVIPANDDPNGVLYVPISSFTATEGSVLRVRVARSAGLFGTVSVPWYVTQGTATPSTLPQVGERSSMLLTRTQTLTGVSGSSWRLYVGSLVQLAVLSDTSRDSFVILKWDGGSTFSPAASVRMSGVQSISIAGRTTQSGEEIFLAATSLLEDSAIYRIGIDGTATLVQRIPIRAASSLVFVQSGDVFVLLGNSDPEAVSPLFKFDAGAGRFLAAQDLSLRGARDLAFVRSRTKSFVAAAVDTLGAAVSRSQLYTLQNGRLVLASQVNTTLARRWTEVRAGDDIMLLLTDASGGAPQIFLLDEASESLRSPSRLNSTGTAPSSTAAFTVGPHVFLATTSDNMLRIFRWVSTPSRDPSTGQQGRFVLERETPASRANARVMVLGLSSMAYVAITSSTDPSASTDVFRMSLIRERTDFWPSSGLVVFQEGQSEQEIVYDILSDGVPELAENFIVSLSPDAVSGGARLLSSNASFEVVIPANEDPYGVISFATESLSVFADEELVDRPVTFRLVRRAGTVGSVSVRWSISTSDLDPNITDVYPLSGTVVFQDGQSEQSFVVIVAADDIPELPEEFIISLEVSSPGPNTARLENALSRAVLTIRGNDDIHGVFALSTTTIPSSPVQESVGTVRLTILRTSGNFGDVLVRYAPAQGSVSPFATDGLDYSGANGSVIIRNGATSAFVDVRIIDDDEPEELESFEFRIVEVILLGLNASYDSTSPRIGAIRSVPISILENDNATGVFEFSVSSLTVDESSAGRNIEIMIKRTRGAFGTAVVGWQVIEAGSTAKIGEDFLMDYAGFVTFSPGVRTQSIFFQVVDDDVPELDESFSVVLLGTSDGLLASPPVLGSVTTLTVTIRANDDVRGLYSFTTESLISTIEEGSSVQLSVRREAGLVDDITVTWRIRELTDTPSPEGVTDFVQSSGTIVFPKNDESVRLRTFTITSIDDSIPEVLERFVVELSVEADGARIKSGFGSAIIQILPSDDANGVFGFRGSQLVRAEESDVGETIYSLTVDRMGGTAGQVTVSWAIMGVCGTSVADISGGQVELPVGNACSRRFQADVTDFAASQQFSGTLVFEEGVTQRTIEFRIAPDTLPEGDEKFYIDIAILRQNLDGGIDASRRRVRVIILANDDGNGVLSFAAASRSNTLAEGSSVMLQVVRTIAAFGNITVDFTIRTSDGRVPVSDIAAPHSGTLQLGDTVDIAEIPITILNDNTPELGETFFVSLSNITGGARLLGGASQAIIIVPANEFPYGRFSVSNALIQMSASGPSREVRFDVLRGFGTIGAVTVSYQMVLESNTSSQARRDVLNAICIPCTVSFADGQSLQQGKVVIDESVFLEQDEVFRINLVDVKLVGLIPEPNADPSINSARGSSSAVVTPSVANNAVKVTPLSQIVEEGQTFEVIVSRGSIRGSLSARWTVRASSGELNTDIAPSSGSIQLAAGTPEIRIPLTAIDDVIPEPAETFIFELSQVEVVGDTLVIRNTRATIVIAENDNVRGVFAFNITTALRVEESVGEVRIPVIRSGGSLGPALVTFSVVGNPQDYTVSNTKLQDGRYTLSFADGSRRGDIVLLMIDDDIPEFAETVEIALLEVTTSDLSATERPRIGSNDKLQLIINANDNPNGRFSFSRTLTTVQEDVRTVTLTVQRLDGTVGVVSVFWRTLPTTGVIVSPGDTSGGSQPVDFQVGSGILTFNEGETLKLITIEIFDDSLGELDEDIIIELSSPTGGAVLDPVGKTATVRILANDSPYGIISFDAAQYAASEVNGTAYMTLVRTGAVFGDATVQWSVTIPSGVPNPASLSDLKATRGVVTFTGTSRSVQIQIPLVQDGPELEEVFDVELSSPSEGASLGPVSRARVAIAENGSPRGLFEFACLDRYGRGNVNGLTDNSVTLTVTRSGGRIGVVQVTVRTTTDGSAELGRDFLPFETVLSFAEGEATKQVVLRTKKLTVSTFGTVVIELVNPVSADLNSNQNRATVSIYTDSATKFILDQTSLAACSPGSTTLASLSEGAGQRLNRQHFASIVAALQELVPNSASKASGVRDTIEQLFAQALAPNTFDASVTDFAPLPALMDMYAEEFLKTKGTAWCPGVDDRSVGVDATIALRRLAKNSEFNGYTLRSSQTKNHTLVLPRGLFNPIGSTSETCGALLLVDFRSSTWFPYRGGYFNSESLASAATSTRGDLEVMSDKVISVLLPAGSKSFTFADPLRYTIPATGDRVGQVPRNLDAYKCVWWNGQLASGAGGWDVAGCRVVDVPGTRAGDISCECSHATQFAVLSPVKGESSLEVIAKVGLGVMACGALLVIVSHIMAGRRTENMSLILHFAVAIFGASLSLLISSLIAGEVSSGGCAAIGLISSYFLAAVCVWVIVICVNLYSMLVKLRSEAGLHFWRYVFSGWVFPALCVVLYIVVHQGARGGSFSTETFGDVLGDKAICVIPDATLWVLVIPAIAAIAVALFVLYSSRRMTSSWLTYDDLYFGRPNMKEVRVVFSGFGLLFMVFLFFALAVLVGGSALSWIFFALALLWFVYIIIFYACSRPVRRTMQGDEKAKKQSLPVHPNELVLRSQTSMVADQSGSGRGTPMNSNHFVGIGASSPFQLQYLDISSATEVDALPSPPPPFDSGRKGSTGRSNFMFPDYAEPVPGIPGSTIASTSLSHSRAVPKPSSATRGAQDRSDVKPRNPREEEEFDDLIFALRTGLGDDYAAGYDEPPSGSPPQRGATARRPPGASPAANANTSSTSSLTDTADVQRRATRRTGDRSEFDLRRVSIADTHL